MTYRDLQIYVVASLPGIGDEMATRLLKQFKTVRKGFQATETGLEKVEGIGRVKSAKLGRLLDTEFQ